MQKRCLLSLCSCCTPEKYDPFFSSCPTPFRPSCWEPRKGRSIMMQPRASETNARGCPCVSCWSREVCLRKDQDEIPDVQRPAGLRTVGSKLHSGGSGTEGWQGLTDGRRRQNVSAIDRTISRDHTHSKRHHLLLPLRLLLRLYVNN